LEDEIGWKTLGVAFDSLIEALGRDGVQAGQVRIEEDLLAAQSHDEGLKRHKGTLEHEKVTERAAETPTHVSLRNIVSTVGDAVPDAQQAQLRAGNPKVKQFRHCCVALVKRRQGFCIRRGLRI
jgi:hypothetical protein